MAKKNKRISPTRECEKCGERYHPRKKNCPGCEATNPSYGGSKKKATKKKVAKRATRQHRSNGGTADVVAQQTVIRNYRILVKSINEVGGIAEAKRLLEVVSLSPDGRYAVIPTSIGRIAKFDLKTNTVRWFRKHNGACLDACFLPTGRQVVSCGGDGIIAVWSADTGATLYRVKAHVNEASAIDVSADGRFVLSAPGWIKTSNAPYGEDLDLKLWRLSEGVWPKNDHPPSTQ